MSRTTVRYSEAFKLNVVEELRQGRFGSPHEAGLAHGIGRGTVSRWLRQYGSEELLAKVVRVEKRGEPGEIKCLKARVRKLETSLADAHMDGALADAFLEMLGEHTDTDIEAFKKKHAATALGGHTRNSMASEA